MLEELRDSKFAAKFGGKFKLTTLIQRRLVELVDGARPLIEDVGDKSPLEIVIEEIKQDKITIADESQEQEPEVDL